MATAWQMRGRYMETCSCDFLCPCPTSNFAARPTQGSCTFAMAFAVEQGRSDAVGLDGLNFVVLGRTPDAMDQGNWSVGVILDERADEGQRQALGTILSGQAGGPLAPFMPLISNFLGVEVRPISFERDGDGMRWSASVPGMLDQALQAVPGANGSDPQYLDNTPHPASSRLALAKATRSRLHAFGLDWEDDSGRNNGHFAPFDWKGG
jgi:hypothetical protein